jgi:hypothetical protein
VEAADVRAPLLAVLSLLHQKKKTEMHNPPESKAEKPSRDSMLTTACVG